jgi:ubiquinone/menaquinone biosynthesis C-methylase UbiE
MTKPAEQDKPTSGEQYFAGYGQGAHRFMAWRGAEQVAFLTKHLRPGMSLLDCGCGPGSITVALAQMLAPGEVVGIDIGEPQIERSRALAAERGVSNVRFQLGNVYELPFPDASFDAALANAVLEHVREPLRALKEMRRVLKPGGVVGVTDTDESTRITSPSTPLLEEMISLALRVREVVGSPRYSTHLRSLLLQAGFARAEAYAVAASFGTPETLRRFAAAIPELLRQPWLVELVTKRGWADQAKLEAMIAEAQAWSQRPDAYHAALDCQAIGWV